MSRRTRYADNSKRQQPVQQQRAQAALQTVAQKKSGTKVNEAQGTQRSAQENER